MSNDKVPVKATDVQASCGVCRRHIYTSSNQCPMITMPCHARVCLVTTNNTITPVSQSRIPNNNKGFPQKTYYKQSHNCHTHTVQHAFPLHDECACRGVAPWPSHLALPPPQFDALLSLPSCCCSVSAASTATWLPAAASSLSSCSLQPAVSSRLRVRKASTP